MAFHCKILHNFSNCKCDLHMHLFIVCTFSQEIYFTRYIYLLICRLCQILYLFVLKYCYLGLSSTERNKNWWNEPDCLWLCNGNRPTFSQVAWTWSNLRPTCKYCEMTRLGLQCLNDIPCHMNSTLSCIKQSKAHVINGASWFQKPIKKHTFGRSDRIN